MKAKGMVIVCKFCKRTRYKNDWLGTSNGFIQRIRIAGYSITWIICEDCIRKEKSDEERK